MKEYLIRSETLEVKFLDFGGRITSIKSAYYDGNLVLAYPETLSADGAYAYPNAAYLTDGNYLGAIIGRFANRIAGGVFSLGGVKYTLDRNDNGINCLHGGNNGYDKRIFNVDCSYSSAALTLHDDDGAFPGNVDIKVKYSVIGSSLMIQYNAVTDKPTVINLTNHTYFNPSGDIGDCEARFNADFYTPLGENMIPDGKIESVAGTTFDFREYKKINRGVGVSDGRGFIGSDYDHNFIVNGTGLRQAAEVYMPKTGLKLAVTTDMPGFQFYTGAFLNEPFSRNEGFCLETQFYPDTPNKAGFPSCVVNPEKPFRSKTIYTFTQGKE